MRNKLKYLFYGSTILTVVIGFLAIKIFLMPGVYFKGEKSVLIIPTGSDYKQAEDSIFRSLNVKNRPLFEWISSTKKYPNLIKPGRYEFSSNLSYIRFINIMRSGRQTPVNVTFNNIRTLTQVAAKIGGQIEADSAQIYSFLSDTSNYRDDGFRKENIIALFIPNTYKVYWNTSAASFYEKMLKEYRKFWTAERIRKAETLKMSAIDVSTLASLVDEETSKSEDKTRIAGVYLNRLRRGMPLQSDPTIKFALNDFSLTRILYRHLKVESPYNTYTHSGLPPGPICCPTVEGIESVLNAENSDYLYFVAKADFSGYHVFSRTLTEHNRYAAEYQKALDKKKIFK
jgi:UPF0755 protein